MTTRRTLLATAGALIATGGCLDSTGSAAPEETTAVSPSDRSPDSEPTDSPSGESTPDDCTSGFHVSAEPFAPAKELPVELDPPQRSLVDSLLPDGSTEVTTYAADPPLRDGVYIERDGNFFRAETTRLSEEEVPARLFDVDWEKGRTPPENATVVAFETLPGADRQALRLVVEGPKYGGEGEEGGHPTQGLSHTDYPAPYPNGTADSRLVGAGTTWVRWNDRAYRVRVDGESTTTRHTFGITVSQVVGDAAGFREHVEREFLRRLSNLPAGEADILQSATGDAYQECAPSSKSLASLQDRLPAAEQLPPPHSQSWYVAFGGERYRLWITNWVE